MKYVLKSNNLKIIDDKNKMIFFKDEFELMNFFRSKIHDDIHETAQNELNTFTFLNYCMKNSNLKDLSTKGPLHKMMETVFPTREKHEAEEAVKMAAGHYYHKWGIWNNCLWFHVDQLKSFPINYKLFELVDQPDGTTKFCSRGWVAFFKTFAKKKTPILTDDDLAYRMQ